VASTTQKQFLVSGNNQFSRINVGCPTAAEALNGRLQAARAMGFAEVPTITLSGLSETQKRALRISDNKIALDAAWDLEILQLELGELAAIDVDIDPT